MSNIERFESIRQMVMLVEPDFNKLAAIHNAVNFAREASFALSVLKDNDYLAQIAMGNPDSLRRAVINVAAIGLSLSPVHKLAYLVPRDRKVCLDISYRGYTQLAVDIGAIKWALAEVVYEKDTFRLRGLGEQPLHEREPFAEKRGFIIGAYVVAKTHDGEYLTTSMSIEEIYSIRDRSQSWRSHKADGKTTPWVTDETEMIKKTVIKRGYKSWPMTDTRRRFDEAVDVTNEVDPIDFSTPAVSPPSEQSHRAESFAKIRENLKELSRTEEKYLEHLRRTFNRDIKALEELTDVESAQSLVFLGQLVANANKSKETARENAG